MSALKLRKMDGSIQEFRPSESPAMVVIFVSAACPMSTEYSERIIQLAVDYSRHGVRILVTNSNQNESDTEVEKQRVEAHLSIPIYRDDGAVAKILGAIATPTAVVIDRGGVTRYFGMIDNSRNPARATKHLLRSALDSVVAGRAVEIPRTKVMGCSIKSAL
ncbi:MAG TPA: redoxin family protein [Bryobacteraceae bacterium]|nr:redoxin family protein [Bryobacteraceae bacterium]